MSIDDSSFTVTLSGLEFTKVTAAIGPDHLPESLVAAKFEVPSVGSPVSCSMCALGLRDQSYLSVHFVINPVTFVRGTIGPGKHALTVEHVCFVLPAVLGSVNEHLLTRSFFLVVSEVALESVAVFIDQNAFAVDEVVDPPTGNNVPRNMV